eukprot:2009336-Pleurochrysis_carterae.AAC.2
MLALILPPSVDAFQTTVAVRELLVGEAAVFDDALIVAPCAHTKPCPLRSGGALQKWHGSKKYKKLRGDSCLTAQRVRASARMLACLWLMKMAVYATETSCEAIYEKTATVPLFQGGRCRA